MIQSRAGAAAGTLRLAELTAAATDAFAEADRAILANISRETSSHKSQTGSSMRGDGTTALCVFVMETAPGSLSVLAAWAGDSRALLIRGGGGGDEAAPDGAHVLRLTEDHKPGRVDEKLRLRAAGGIVENVQGVW